MATTNTKRAAALFYFAATITSHTHTATGAPVRSSIPPPAWACMQTANLDYPGNDLDSALVATPAACEVLCQATAECTHATYAWETCWMKKGVAADMQAMPGAMSIACTRGSVTIATAKATTTTTPAPTTAPEATATATEVQVPTVTATAVTDKSSNISTGNTSDTSDTSANTGNITLLMLQLAAAAAAKAADATATADARNTFQCTVRLDHDFAGHDIAHHPIYSHSVYGCASHCNRDARCTHFSYVTRFRRCFLKSSLSKDLMPLPTAAAALTPVFSKGTVAGHTCTYTTPAPPASLPASDVTMAWSVGAPMPVALGEVASAKVRDLIVVVGEGANTTAVYVFPLACCPCL